MVYPVSMYALRPNLGFRDIEPMLANGERVGDRLLNNRWLFMIDHDASSLKFSFTPILTNHEFFRLGHLAFRTIFEYRLNVLLPREGRKEIILLSVEEEQDKVCFCILFI
jgi:hypothetical protein